MNWFLIDAGNTTINLGLAKKNKFRIIGRFLSPDFLNKIPSLIKKNKPSKALICSVVPELSKKLRQLFRKYKIEVLECGRDVKIPVRNLYKRPEEVGSDRLLNVYAAVRLYKNVGCVIDSGTALTIDIISKKGAYLGGFIFPGLSFSLEALLKRCALLPKQIKLKPRRNFSWGRSTIECISSGTILGYSLLISKIIDYLKKRRRFNFKVVLTGGDSPLLIKNLTNNIEYFEPQLILKGLNVLRQNIEKKQER